MESVILNQKHFGHAENIFSEKLTSTLLFGEGIALLVVLHHIKSSDWPWKSLPFSNEPSEIPLVWALFHALAVDKIEMQWDVHPMKCLPNEYCAHNPNSQTSRMPAVRIGNATLGGCRGRVNECKRGYEVNTKNIEYCSVFGLPDDCYDPGFEKRMIYALMQSRVNQFWCLEKTQYLADKIEPHIVLHQMKSEFLPSKYFVYIDTSEHFLRGIYTSKELTSLSDNRWYSNGREMIEDMDLSNEQGYRFEEQAKFYIRQRLINEFIRLSLLLFNRDKFSMFSSTSSPPLDIGRKTAAQAKMTQIIDQARAVGEMATSTTLQQYRDKIDRQAMIHNRFMVIDVEYLHVTYPTGKEGFFNFPCAFSCLVWQGTKGLSLYVNIFQIPCHSCTQICHAFKNSLFEFGCLSSGLEFIENQVAFTQQMLSRYEGFKIYSYGRSDAFQLEQGTSFFTDSFEWRLYERRNRKREKRIVDLISDLSVEGKELKDLEKEVLATWLPGWSRQSKKVNVNTRFMVKYENQRWEESYHEAVNSCISDTISAFLLLIQRKYRR